MNYNCGDILLSDKQRSLLLDIVAQQDLNKEDINTLARNRFNKTVKELNKLEMSGLITELLETYTNGSGKRKGSSRQTDAPAGRSK